MFLYEIFNTAVKIAGQDLNQAFERVLNQILETVVFDSGYMPAEDISYLFPSSLGQNRTDFLNHLVQVKCRNTFPNHAAQVCPLFSKGYICIHELLSGPHLGYLYFSKHRMQALDC